MSKACARFLACCAVAVFASLFVAYSFDLEEPDWIHKWLRFASSIVTGGAIIGAAACGLACLFPSGEFE